VARFSLAACAFLLALAGCGEDAVVSGAGSSGPELAASAGSSETFGELPDFRLTAQDGRTLTREDLRGHPLVLGALFSTCNGPCPTIARSLANLQEDLAGTDVRFVVVSVDPEVDSPEVLAHYAERFGADPERWLFLTGQLAEVTRLVREGLLLPFDRLPEGGEIAGDRVTHDTRLVAVDRRGQRRGWYQGLDEVELAKLRKRMLFLASEDAGR
jgi:protein SCO1/2